jgi:serine/threonine-protein kinase
VSAFKLLFVAVILLAVFGCVNSEIVQFTESTIEGDLESGMPDGWSLVGSAPEEYSVFRDRAVVNDGNAAISVLSTGAPNNRFSTLRQVIDAGVYAGKRVQFQAYVRTSRVQESAGLWMRADSRSRASIAFDNMDDRRIKGTTDWQQYSIVLDIPEDAVVIYYGVLLEGNGQIWIDTCSLNIVSEETKTTGMYLESYSREYQEPAGILSVPSNMDFEGKMN